MIKDPVCGMKARGEEFAQALNGRMAYLFSGPGSVVSPDVSAGAGALE